MVQLDHLLAKFRRVGPPRPIITHMDTSTSNARVSIKPGQLQAAGLFWRNKPTEGVLAEQSHRGWETFWPSKATGSNVPEPIRVDVTPSEHVTAIAYPAATGHRAGISLILAHG